MSFRILLAAILALACGPASAATSRVRPAPPKLPGPAMQFYVVKGAPDACGRGCDSWIAIEGKIDSNAAARFRKFFARVRGRNLPLYLYSPGGNVEQALAIGGILREKPAVAHTVSWKWPHQNLSPAILRACSNSSRTAAGPA